MSDGDRPAVWQCVRCLGRVPGVSPDAQFQFCPLCGCPQSPQTEMSVSEGRRCRNPDCRAQLIIPTAPFCHKCRTRQQQLPEQQQSEQIAHPGLSVCSACPPIQGILQKLETCTVDSKLSLEQMLDAIPPQRLDQKVNDTHLGEIARKLIDWKSVCTDLAIKEAEEKAIEEENKEVDARRYLHKFLSFY